MSADDDMGAVRAVAFGLLPDPIQDSGYDAGVETHRALTDAFQRNHHKLLLRAKERDHMYRWYVMRPGHIRSKNFTLRECCQLLLRHLGEIP